MILRREQEDIAKLVSETGMGTDVYRSFDQSAQNPIVGSVSTPLLGEIFAKSVGDVSLDVSPSSLLPPRPPVAAASAATPARVELPPRPLRPPAADDFALPPITPQPREPMREALRVPPRPAPERVERPAERPHLRAVPTGPAEEQEGNAEGRSSLDAIRNILARREEPAVAPKRAGPLSGLFDRLAK